MSEMTEAERTGAKELDARVAVEVMGWQWYLCQIDSNKLTTQRQQILTPSLAASWRGDDEDNLESEGNAPRWKLTSITVPEAGIFTDWSCPRYSTDIAAAWEMEEAIAYSDGLAAVYAKRLIEMAWPHVFAGYADAEAADDDGFYDLDRGDVFDLIHASPELRCRAALAAVRDAEGK